MVAVLAALGPALFVLLPRRIGATLALAVSVLLLVEMHDVVHPQQADAAGSGDAGPADRAVLPSSPTTSRRCPRPLPCSTRSTRPSELPDVYIDDTGVPSFPDYTFQGPSLQRRTHYLPTPASPAEVIGPFLTQNGALAERLAASGDLVVDQLSPEIWLLLPKQRAEPDRATVGGR